MKISKKGSITLSAKETALWESSGSDGADFRSAVRDSARNHSSALGGRTVEIYSHDGITMDVLEEEPSL